MSTTEPFAMLGDPAARDHAEPAIAAEEYDALTELFLGEAERRPVAADRPAERSGADEPSDAVGVNLLVMGHLPVQASPWASQHARRLAMQIGGPVAMLRLRSGHAALDLYGDLDADPHAELADLSAAIDWAGARAARWLLRVDDLEEVALAGVEHVGAVTLLTGCNDMAVVNAYRVIKALSAAASPGTELRVAMMGGEPDAAESAMHRLGEAARGFLQREVVFFEPVERIEPVPFSAVYSGRCGVAPADLVERVIDASRRTEQQTLHDSPEHDEAREAIEAVRTAEDDAPPNEPQEVEAPAAAAPPESVFDPLERVEPKPASRSARRPDREPERQTRPGALCGYVAGLQKLGIRCRPDHRVELAIGVDGRLHLLGDEAVVGLRGLRQAADWVTQHAELIALASPRAGGEVTIREDVGPELHVFTAEPKRILGACDPMWRVHLLAPVNNGWYHTELT